MEIKNIKLILGVLVLYMATLFFYWDNLVMLKFASFVMFILTAIVLVACFED